MTDETLETHGGESRENVEGTQSTDENALGACDDSQSDQREEEILEPIVIAEEVEADCPNELVELVPVAEIVSEGSVQRSMDDLGPPIPKQFQNLSANGGAVTAFALGLFAIVGAFFSDISAFNALMGLCFGIWGANSNLKRTNTIGLTFCLIALVICIGT